MTTHDSSPKLREGSNAIPFFFSCTRVPHPSHLTGNSLVSCPDSCGLWSTSSGTWMPGLLLPSWGSMLLLPFKSLSQTLSSHQHHLTSSKAAEAVAGPRRPQGISSMNPISNGSPSGSFFHWVLIPEGLVLLPLLSTASQIPRPYHRV